MLLLCYCEDLLQLLLGTSFSWNGILSKSCGHDSSSLVIICANCVLTNFVNGSILLSDDVTMFDNMVLSILGFVFKEFSN